MLVTTIIFLLGGVTLEVHLHTMLSGRFMQSQPFGRSSFEFVQDIFCFDFTSGRQPLAGVHVVGILQQVWVNVGVWSNKFHSSVLNGYTQLFVNVGDWNHRMSIAATTP